MQASCNNVDSVNSVGFAYCVMHCKLHYVDIKYCDNIEL